MKTGILMFALYWCGRAVAYEQTVEDASTADTKNLSTSEPLIHPNGSTDHRVPPQSFTSGALSAFSVIAVSELGDKTFFIAVVLALSYSPLCVFLGAISALAFMTILSAGLGMVSAVIPYLWVQILSATLFIVFGIKMLREGYIMKSTAGKEEFEDVQKTLDSKIASKSKVLDAEAGTPKGAVRWVFLEAFAMTFLAEWGDRSQITTVILAAKDSVAGVIVGATLGHAACTLLAVIGGRIVADRISLKIDCDYYDDDGCRTGSPEPSCVFSECKPPNCSCFGSHPDIQLIDRPQFVMLTFDDAITVANIDTYRSIIKGRRNKRGSQNIKLTFFVCHEYNDYELTRELYSQGHEIAVHSISHESNTDLWRNGNLTKWKQEMAGMRLMLSTFGLLPQEEIVGHRAPFLQTSGDTTFNMLKREGFLYDSSMPTRNYIDPPIWPYTLDHSYSQDCQIEPCPKDKYAGLWEVPMIQYQLRSRDGVFYCSMADACTPQPKTKTGTVEFLMSNFNRHHRSNKAPFPLFLHEAWLRDPFRLQGYLSFLDEILKKDDVFVVTVKDVIEYMKNPVAYWEYSSRMQKIPRDCTEPKSCKYEEPLRIMKSCSQCPPYYPWVGTPLGRRRPVLPDPDR